MNGRFASEVSCVRIGMVGRKRPCFHKLPFALKRDKITQSSRSGDRRGRVDRRGRRPQHPGRPRRSGRFYVFEDTNWGRNSAHSWATIKSDNGGEPIVLRYKIRKKTFDSLYIYHVSDNDLTNFIQQYSRDNLTGYDVVVGGVGMRANNGQLGDRVRNYRFPNQFKFEGDAIHQLIFDGVVK